MKQLSEGIYPGLICAIVIMVLMGLPGSYFPTVVSFWDWLGPDKIAHLILFGTLSFISLWGYRKKMSDKDMPFMIKMSVITIIITISYGGLTELLQKHVFINRYGCIFDFIADAIGCILGTIAFFFIHKKKIKKIEKSDNNI